MAKYIEKKEKNIYIFRKSGKKMVEGFATETVSQKKKK